MILGMHDVLSMLALQHILFVHKEQIKSVKTTKQKKQRETIRRTTKIMFENNKCE